MEQKPNRFGYANGNTDQPGIQQLDTTIFTNFECKTNQKNIRELKIDYFMPKPEGLIQPKGKPKLNQICLLKYPIKIRNKTTYPIYHLFITHEDINPQAASQRKFFTKYLNVKSQIDMKDWPFYLYPLNPAQEQTKQKKSNLNKNQQQTQLLSQIQQITSVQLTDIFRIHFYIHDQGKYLPFTNSPQIRYIQNQSQLSQLKFAFDGKFDVTKQQYVQKHQRFPTLQLIITEPTFTSQSIQFLAILQISYPDEQGTVPTKYKSNILAEPIDIYGGTTYQKEQKLRSDKELYENHTLNQTLEELKRKNGSHKFYFKRFQDPKQASRNSGKLVLFQSIIDNCYMVTALNQLLTVSPHFFKQNNIILFDKQLKKICLALNINGKTTYIGTDLTLPYSLSQDGQQKLVFSYPGYIPQQQLQKPSNQKDRQAQSSKPQYTQVQHPATKKIQQQPQIKTTLQPKQKPTAQQYQYSKQQQFPAESQKYQQIKLCMYVQKCLAMYFSKYQYLERGQPNWIFTMLTNASTYSFRPDQSYKYRRYFQNWQQAIDDDWEQKYLITLSTRADQKSQNSVIRKYFQESFIYPKAASSLTAFFNHNFAFSGLSKIGNIDVIKVQDYRQEFILKKIPILKKCFKLRFKQKYPNVPDVDKKVQSLAANQFFLTFQDVKGLKIKIHVGVLNKNVHYRSRQLLLKKGEVLHLGIRVQVNDTQAEIAIHQDHKRLFRALATEPKQVAQTNTYSKVEMELWLNQKVKLNIFQRHDKTNNISWLKCYLKKAQTYSLMLGIRQIPFAQFQFCTLSLKSKNKLDEIILQKPSPTQQHIWCLQMLIPPSHKPTRYLTFPLSQHYQRYFQPQALKNYCIIQSWSSFSAFEIKVHQQHEQKPKQLKIKVHKLDVEKQDYVEHNGLWTLQTYRPSSGNRIQGGKYTSYPIIGSGRFEPGIYKIILSFLKEPAEHFYVKIAI